MKVGARKSPNYYRIYHDNQEIRFELEIKHTRVQTVQHLLFDGQIQEFEESLTQHFYLHSKKILVLHHSYTDWMINHFRRKEKPDAAFLVPYFNQKSLSLPHIKKVFGLLQFLSFSTTKPFEEIILGHQQYYVITFPLKDFAKFLGEEEKYNTYGDRYRQQKYIQFFNNLQCIKPLITTFSDQTFQSSVAFPTVAIDKINFDWVAQVSIAKNLYLYDHLFYLSKSLIIYKNTYELQIKFQILQNFSVDDLEKKLHVQKLLMRFNASQKIQADNKKEIIRQFNQLPIQEEYKLVLKNGQTKIIHKLTSHLIGKTKTIYFYEKL